MRQHKLAIGLVAVILIAGGSTYASLKYQAYRRAQAAEAIRQAQISQMKEWEANLQQWQNQQTEDHISQAAQQTDLARQGVTTLPNTGTGHMGPAVVLVTLSSGLLHAWLTKPRLISEEE